MDASQSTRARPLKQSGGMRQHTITRRSVPVLKVAAKMREPMRRIHAAMQVLIDHLSPREVRFTTAPQGTA